MGKPVAAERLTVCACDFIKPGSVIKPEKHGQRAAEVDERFIEIVFTHRSGDGIAAHAHCFWRVINFAEKSDFLFYCWNKRGQNIIPGSYADAILA